MAKKAASLFGDLPKEEPTALLEARGEASRPAYREGKKPFTTWVNEKALRQFKAIAAEEGMTVQDLQVQIMNREFARRGRPEIA